MTKGIVSDKTRIKQMRWDRAYDYDARIYFYENKIAELQREIAQAEQDKRIAEKHNVVPVSGAELRVGMTICLLPNWLSGRSKFKKFPFAPYLITKKVKSRAYSGSHPPDWNIHLEAIGHDKNRGPLSVRDEEFFWVKKS